MAPAPRAMFKAWTAAAFMLLGQRAIGNVRELLESLLASRSGCAGRRWVNPGWVAQDMIVVTNLIL